MTETIMVGLIFLPIIGSIIGYVIGYHDAKRIYQKFYWKMTDEEIDKCRKWVNGKGMVSKNE